MPTTAALTENSRQGFKPEKPDCIGLENLLSRNLRHGCGHVYDETPVGLVVYVRNDPVNHIDPDGRNRRYIQGYYTNCNNDGFCDIDFLDWEEGDEATREQSAVTIGPKWKGFEGHDMTRDYAIKARSIFQNVVGNLKGCAGFFAEANRIVKNIELDSTTRTADTAYTSPNGDTITLYNYQGKLDFQSQLYNTPGANGDITSLAGTFAHEYYHALQAQIGVQGGTLGSPHPAEYYAYRFELMILIKMGANADRVNLISDMVKYHAQGKDPGAATDCSINVK